MYALLCERMLGQRPARVQLFYLSKPEAIIATPTDQSITRRRAQAPSRCGPRSPPRASATTSGRKPGRLCDFCTFKPYCPAHGGDPVDAAELRGPGTVIDAARSAARPAGAPLVGGAAPPDRVGPAGR